MNVNYLENFHYSSKFAEVEVGTAALMEAWKSSWQALLYSEKGFGAAGCDVSKSRSDFYQRKIRDGEPIKPPRLFISSRGEPEIVDGLVRLIVLQQMGVEKVRLCVPRADAKEFLERFEALNKSVPEALLEAIPAAGPQFNMV